MEKTYNVHNLEALFKKYLLSVNDSCESHSENMASSSVRNYLSDFRFFWGWLVAKAHLPESFDDAAQMATITKDHVLAFRQFMVEEKLPLITVNRRLSTIRRFFRFCVSQGWISVNPAHEVQNIRADRLILELGTVKTAVTGYAKSKSKPSDEDLKTIEEYFITNFT